MPRWRRELHRAVLAIVVGSLVIAPSALQEEELQHVRNDVHEAALLHWDPLRRGRDFWIVAQESGTARHDLPIFSTYPGAIVLESRASAAAIVQSYVPGVPGAVVLQDVLTSSECERLLVASESMGYTEDAPVNLGRHIRRNENCVWVVNPELNAAIFDRVRALLPSVGKRGGAIAGLNARWRLYKYGPGDTFRLHTDGSWPGSEVRDEKLVRDAYGDRWSEMTLVLYLSRGFEGGQTTFAKGKRRESVSVPLGGAIAYWHGDNPQSPLHEGSLVTRGTKYILRTDVLFMTGRRPASEL